MAEPVEVHPKLSGVYDVPLERGCCHKDLRMFLIQLWTRAAKQSVCNAGMLNGLGLRLGFGLNLGNVLRFHNHQSFNQ